jgi:hypothetical protein
VSTLVHILILWAFLLVTLLGIWIVGRRHALHPPQGSGAIRFAASAFGIILGLTTFFATEQVSSLSAAAQNEASSLGDLVISTGTFPPAIGREVRRQSFCYANDVIEADWPAMRDGKEFGAPLVERREAGIYAGVVAAGHVRPEPTTLNTAVSAGLQVGREREQRLLLNQPQIPPELWALLYVGSAIIFVFVFFDQLGYGEKRASRRERFWTCVGVVVMLTAVIAVLAHLDHPTEDPYGLEPTAMRHELKLIGESIPGNPSNPKAYCSTVPVPKGQPATLS